MPAHPARVRQLLRDGKAIVNRRLPFSIRLKTRKGGDTQPVAIKLDPGAKTTGIALVRKVESNPQIQTVLFLAELTHRGYLAPAKSHFGFRTGDLVTASVPSGVNAGRHTGRVAVRASGSFNIQSALGTAQGISHKHCRKLQQADGYSYQQSTRGFPSALKDRVSSPSL